MEVLSFIISDKKIIDYFQSFINSWSKLKFGTQDNDTKFYINPITGKNELYFHFHHNDIEDQFRYNYSSEEQDEIKKYFGKKDFYIYDIQYINEVLLDKLLYDFNHYLKSKNPQLNKEVLLGHTTKGIMNLS